MFLVGVTGGIATGKSTVSQIFSELGCTLIDADLVAREVVEAGKPAWKKIVKHFGKEIVNEDGTLKREKLGEIIFDDASERQKLNSFTHKEILKSMLCSVIWNVLTGKQFILLDIPLLFETKNLLPYMSEVIVVSCRADLQLERLIRRNSFSEADAQQRINTQMPLADKCKRATYVVDNSGSIADTKQQVMKIHQRLMASRKHWVARLGLLAAFISVFGTLGACVLWIM